MTNQKLSLSKNDIPTEWKERFYIKRIGEEDIEISLEARDEILKSLNAGVRFIQIGKYTLMLNSIKSIDPKWGSKNIPPRPKVSTKIIGLNDETRQMMYEENKEDLERRDLWDQLFGEKEELYLEK